MNINGIRMYLVAHACLLFACGSVSAQESVQYIHTDALGSPIAISDASGTLVDRTVYEPFGATVGRTNGDAPSYTGHVSDRATGLTYMQQRYYDPDVGKFLSVDPVTMYRAGDARYFNVYSYAFNAPYSFKDPDGRCPVCPFLVGAGVGMAVDYGIQKMMNPGKPINKTELFFAGAAGAITGGTGGLAIGAVARGSITVGQAVAIQATVGAAANVAGTAGQGALEGTSVTSAQLGVSAAGGALSSLGGSAIGIMAGDFAQASTQGALLNMSKASVNSPGGIGFHIAATTASSGRAGVAQGAVQGAMSNAGQRSADVTVGALQKVVEEKVK